jgi:hypothetical protein
MTCRTVYAVGIPACPHCGGTEHGEGEEAMAKASAEGGATHYVAAGDPVPDDLPAGVRLVGPGAPVEGTEHPADGTISPPISGDGDGEPGEQVIQLPDGEYAKPDGPALSAAGDDDEDGPPDYMAYRVVDLRDLARDRGLPVTGAKADLAAALAAWDADHPDGLAAGGAGDGDDAARAGE